MSRLFFITSLKVILSQELFILVPEDLSKFTALFFSHDSHEVVPRKAWREELLQEALRSNRLRTLLVEVAGNANDAVVLQANPTVPDRTPFRRILGLPKLIHSQVLASCLPLRIELIHQCKRRLLGNQSRLGVKLDVVDLGICLHMDCSQCICRVLAVAILTVVTIL
jgi:hypothetical protein